MIVALRILALIALAPLLAALWLVSAVVIGATYLASCAASWLASGRVEPQRWDR